MKTNGSLSLKPSQEIARIIKFIQKIYENMGREGAIIALSGGLDSAVTAQLLVNSLGIKNVKLLYMPEADSKRIHGEHARRFSYKLGIPLQIKNITPVLRKMGAYRLLPIGFVPGKWLRGKLIEFGRSKMFAGREKSILVSRLKSRGNSLVSRGNAYGLAKHRARMIMVYQIADTEKLMVVGAANLTERMTGTFSKWGVDHCADIMPIAHLYRTQVEQIAEHLEIPEYIRNKPADPDLFPGLPDKGELLGGFNITDQILASLDRGETEKDLSEKFDRDVVDRVVMLRQFSEQMRESPYSLN